MPKKTRLVNSECPKCGRTYENQKFCTSDDCPGVIRTEQDLDAHIDALPESDVRQIVKQIATLWFVEEDGTLNLNKELGSDHLEAVTQVLTSRGIMPTN